METHSHLSSSPSLLSAWRRTSPTSASLFQMQKCTSCVRRHMLSPQSSSVAYHHSTRPAKTVKSRQVPLRRIRHNKKTITGHQDRDANASFDCSLCDDLTHGVKANEHKNSCLCYKKDQSLWTFGMGQHPHVPSERSQQVAPFGHSDTPSLHKTVVRISVNNTGEL